MYSICIIKMLNILFGILPWVHWTNAIKKLPYNIYFIEFDDPELVKDYVATHKIDIMFAITKQQNFFVIDNYNLFKKYVNKIFYNTNKDIINLLIDKHRFCSYMNMTEYKIHIPTTLISCVHGKQLFHNKVVYPCIYKLCVSSGGASSHIIENKTQLIKTLRNNKQHFVIQEYITSCDEYSGHFYVRDGNIIFSKIYHLVNKKTNYIQKGRMLNYNTVDNQNYINVFQSIFKMMNYTGFACIDYKLINNIPIIFEINPRLGATIVVGIEDFILMINHLNNI
jgi:predicted ATP-grasp superfamily ATP-dependent carboligase